MQENDLFPHMVRVTAEVEPGTPEAQEFTDMRVAESTDGGDFGPSAEISEFVQQCLRADGYVEEMKQDPASMQLWMSQAVACGQIAAAAEFLRVCFGCTRATGWVNGHGESFTVWVWSPTRTFRIWIREA